MKDAIKCAKKFFDTLNQRAISKSHTEKSFENVKYDVVNSYDKLMDLVGVS